METFIILEDKNHSKFYNTVNFPKMLLFWHCDDFLIDLILIVELVERSLSFFTFNI